MGLGNAYFSGDLHLGLSGEVAEGEDTPLTLGELFHGLGEGDVLKPALVGVLHVAHLIHHADALAGVGVYGVKEAHRRTDGIHAHSDGLRRCADGGGKLVHARLALVLVYERLTRLHDAIGRIPQRARHAQRGIVPQIAAYLARDHGHAVGGEAHVVIFQVKMVDGLDETDTADLKQIVHILAAPDEFLEDGEHEPQIAAYQLVPRSTIAGLRLLQKRPRFLAFQHRQARRIHAAYLNLSLHSKTALSSCKR